MKKEIKRILNEIKDEDNYIEDLGFRYKRIAKNFIGDDKVNKDFIYEEQKQLIEMWKNKYYEQKEKLEQLENNRDKAIEYINKNIAIYHKQLPLIAIDYEEVINILKGDSDDQR